MLWLAGMVLHVVGYVTLIYYMSFWDMHTSGPSAFLYLAIAIMSVAVGVSIAWMGGAIWNKAGLRNTGQKFEHKGLKRTGVVVHLIIMAPSFIVLYFAISNVLHTGAKKVAEHNRYTSSYTMETRQIMEDMEGSNRSSPELIQSFVTALDSDSEDIRAIAAKELGVRGESNEEVLPALRKALADPKPLVRTCAAYAVWKLTDDAEEVIPVLLAQLDDEDVALSDNVLIVFQEMGPKAASAIPTLEKLRKDANPKLERSIGYALEAIQPKAHKERE